MTYKYWSENMVLFVLILVGLQLLDSVSNKYDINLSTQGVIYAHRVDWNYEQ